jgi:hypothetical protein
MQVYKAPRRAVLMGWNDGAEALWRPHALFTVVADGWWPTYALLTALSMQRTRSGNGAMAQYLMRHGTKSEVAVCQNRAASRKSSLRAPEVGAKMSRQSAAPTGTLATARAVFGGDRTC